MKKNIWMVALALMAMPIFAEVQETFTEREIRDPVKLEAILENNFGELADDGVGAAVAGVTTIAETATVPVQTVISFTNVVETATDGSDEGESQKILDFDAGAFTVLGVIVDATVVNTPGATNTFVMSLGSVAAADDATLTGTEVDFAPSATIDTVGGTVLTNAFDAVLGAAVIWDGTGTAKDLYLNIGIADADMTTNVTFTVTGTATIISTKAVDN